MGVSPRGGQSVIADRYSLDREIGRGGTGPVWLGRDELLGRQVALKRIGRLPGADATDLARAEREARLSARLNHPNVVTVFDVAVDDDGYWLVMEYVDGVTLGQLVEQRGPLAPDDAAPLLLQVADALAGAHRAGIVHRDVKPSNILVDRKGEVRLTDFGIARNEADPSLTQTGLVTGSPAYLAPEVARGERSTEASDVWSLGATVFHVLSGRPPYDIGENVLGALYRIVHEEPPRLPGAGSLTTLLDATMAREPSERWSMAQVRDFLAGRVVTPGPAPHTRVLHLPQPELQPAVATTAIRTPPTATVSSPAISGGLRERRPLPSRTLLGLGALSLLFLAVVVYAVLAGRDPEPGPMADRSQTPASQTAGPTAQGIESFIRDYVSTVGEDPDAAWKMLTPKFQRESGGLGTYRDFWDEATNGRVLDISTNPEALTVSYQVRFDNFDNGPGPTVLDLEYDDGRYRIDGERTEGFVPAG